LPNIGGWRKVERVLVTKTRKTEGKELEKPGKFLVRKNKKRARRFQEVAISWPIDGDKTKRAFYLSSACPKSSSHTF
jgi:hypothetical protein